MKAIVTCGLALLFCLQCSADEKHLRPRILGIAGVEFYSTNVAAARHFYSQVLHPEEGCLWCEQIPRSPMVVVVNLNQAITLSTPPKAPPVNLLYEVDFAVDDVKAMRAFLKVSKVASKDDKKGHFPVVTDPEGHRIGFVQAAAGIDPIHIIHTGFVVHDRAAEDKFYKDILGFHLYWHGGMKEGEDNWVDMQVPDGTDWIEYMLGVAPDASHKTLGVMNHIALGVPDIHAAQEQLVKNGWKGTEEPKIGRDGKWQLNLYDPDETRVELMEFKPTKEPCCAPYTGPHPGP